MSSSITRLQWCVAGAPESSQLYRDEWAACLENPARRRACTLLEIELGEV
jgi:hypothetical protein